MTTRSWFEYDVMLPPPYGIPGWRRSRFSYHPQVYGLGEPDPPGDREAHAREMLAVMADRTRPGARFRLVRVTEEIVGEELVRHE